MKRKLKMEAVLAIMMTVAISFFTVYVNQSKLVEMGSDLNLLNYIGDLAVPPTLQFSRQSGRIFKES